MLLECEGERDLITTCGDNEQEENCHVFYFQAERKKWGGKNLSVLTGKEKKSPQVKSMAYFSSLFLRVEKRIWKSYNETIDRQRKDRYFQFGIL